MTDLQNTEGTSKFADWKSNAKTTREVVIFFTILPNTFDAVDPATASRPRGIG